MSSIAGYTTTDELGGGSHGQVFRAMPPERLPVSGPVALKVFDRHTDTAEYERVVAEMTVYAAAANACPQLAEVHEVGRHGERMFMSVQFFEMGSLTDRAQTMNKLDVVKVVADAARGAHALHEAGLVHREIKPANVFLTGTGSGALADLGLAHVVSPGKTVSGLGVSSMETMEPGLMRGEPSARASDIWSLGATLHWALTGRGVFSDLPDDNLVSVLRHIMIAQPDLLLDGMPPPVQAILTRCLSPERMDRYPTAQALAADLDEVEGLVTA